MELRDSSRRISELETVSSLLDTDYLIYNYSEDGFSQQSRKIKILDLCNFLFSQISSELSIGTMAMESKYGYSKYGHTHDFSEVKLYPMVEDGDTIGYFNVSSDYGNSQISVKVPSYEDPVYEEPYIGEIRIIYGDTPTEQQIRSSIENGTFDGWIYADGRLFCRYDCYYDFSRAYEIFKGSNDYFTIPDVRGFVGFVQNPNEALVKFPYQNGLSSHTHETCEINNVSVDISSDVISYHGGDSGEINFPKTSAIKNKKKNSNITDISCENVRFNYKQMEDAEVSSVCQNFESYPKHNVIPSMIYIGKDNGDFVKTWGVTFISDNKVLKNDRVYDGGSGIPPQFEKMGYDLTAWNPTYENITCDTSCYAQFKLKYYDIKFDLNGKTGTIPETQNIGYGNKITEPGKYIVNGYEVEGWYTEKECVNKWDFSTDVVTGEMTLYGKFNIRTYSIKYVLNGGTNHKDNPKTYTIETDDINLKNATLDNYIFTGWYYNGTKIKTIPKGSYGDLELEARWSNSVPTGGYWYTYPATGKYVEATWNASKGKWYGSDGFAQLTVEKKDGYFLAKGWNWLIPYIVFSGKSDNLTDTIIIMQPWNVEVIWHK